MSNQTLQADQRQRVGYRPAQFHPRVDDPPPWDIPQAIVVDSPQAIGVDSPTKEATPCASAC